MKNINIITPENELKKSINNRFKLNRMFEQSAFYLNNGANLYYNTIFGNDSEDGYKDGIKKAFDIFVELFPNKDENIAFFSLGCGDAIGEKDFLQTLANSGYKIIYYGIDSSMEMVNMAQENLKNTTFEKHLICADFTSDIFIKELSNNIAAKYSKRLFAFLGRTFGNVPQNYIADILRNMLHEGDILWLDLRIRNKDDDLSVGEIFEIHSNRLKDPYFKNFITQPLLSYNIPLDIGDLIIEMKRENSVNTLLFTYGFMIKKKTEIEIDGEIFTFLPNDIIELINIRNYEPNYLVSFLESRHFKFLTMYKQGIKNLHTDLGELFFKKVDES